MSKSRLNKKIQKYISANIQNALCYIDAKKFPFDCDRLSDQQLIEILTVFIRSGKTFDEIKTELGDIADGKTTELSDFVNNYPKKKRNAFAEEIIMVFIGIFIASGLLKIIMNFQ